MRRLYVLDAWAILALLQGAEPAATQVSTLLREAEQDDVLLLMSIVNLGEVYYRVGKVKGGDRADATLETIRSLSVEFVSATDDRVLAAARLKMSHALSYADAFAAATAKERDALLVSGDPELLALHGIIRLEPLTRAE
jgi:predicted nucleic acid-binding protein